MGENWRPIPGYRGEYDVSDHGRVRSLARIITVQCSGRSYDRPIAGRILKPIQKADGHLLVSLGRGGQHFIHRLVLYAFSGPCLAEMEARHLDGNPANNKIGNLAWGTRQENINDRIRLGEHNPPMGERHGRAKFCEDDVSYIRRLYKQGRSHGWIANHLGASRSSVGKVCMGKTWRHVR